MEITSKVREIFKYLKLKVKIRVTLNKIWFNKECLRRNIIPKYAKVNIKDKSNTARKVKAYSESMWIKTEIKYLYSQLNKYNKEVYNKYWQLWQQYSFLEIEEIVYGFGEDYINNKVKKREVTIKKKLDKLIKDNMQNERNNNTYAQRVVNLTEVQFNEEEVELLEKGLKYAPPKKINKEDVLIECESIIGRMENEDDKKRIRFEVSKIVEEIDMNKNNKPRERDITRRIRNLKEKIKDNKLIVTKADKGNTTVIMEKTEYINKAEEFIKQGPYEEIKYNYTNRYQAKIKKLIKESTMLRNFNKTQLIESNPSAPTFKCQVKLHKEGRPIRPIVSFIGAPGYKLTKLTSKIVKQNYEFKKIFSIKNSIELIEELKDVEINRNTILITIDVKDMFTNIPKEKVMELIKENGMSGYQHKDQVVKITETLMEQNYFRFNNKFYKQTKGLPMGSSLSPIMSEIYMNNFENKFLNNSVYRTKIKKWVRYVDDILIIWEGSIEEIKKLIEELNNIETGLQFKEEIGVDKISYLDIRIIISENRKLEFDIYRKSTYTDAIIPKESFHPMGYKIAAINAMCYRAIRCLNNKITLDKEVGRIKNIIKNNNFKPKIVDKIIQKINKTKDKRSINEEVDKEKYLGAISYVGWKTEKIRNCFKKYGIKVATKRSKTVFDYIKNNETEEIPKTQKSGVYKVKCEECEMVYIGESGRAIECRLREHRRGENDRNTSSLYARHFMVKKHKFVNPTEKFEILNIENKSNKRKLREELEILKQRIKDSEKLMNIKTYFENEDIFYYILKNYEEK